MSWIALLLFIGFTLAFVNGYKKGQERKYKLSVYHDNLKAMRVDNPDSPYELSNEVEND